MRLNETLIEYSGDDRKLYQALRRLTGQSGRKHRLQDEAFWSSSECHQEIRSMVSHLNTQAPGGYYFGVNPWDPFSFGFWRYVDD